MQITTLLHGRAALEADRAWVSADAAGDLLADTCDATSIAGATGVRGAWRSRSEVGDVLRDRVAGADAGDADIRGFAGFAEGVVARVEVFALLFVGRGGVLVGRGLVVF
jgi:hypothetical protein